MAHIAHDTLDAETLAWLDDAGSEYNDDESDFSTRYAETPRVEPIRKPESHVHVVGAHWSQDACLCNCHYGYRDCDDSTCRAWGAQNTRKVERDAERRIARKQARLRRQLAS